MAKRRPGSGKKRPSQSGSGRRKPYVRKPPFGVDKAESLIESKFERAALHLRRYFNKKGPMIDTRIVVHRHADDTVTADLDIVPLSPKLKIEGPEGLIFQLHPVLDKTAVRGAWLSIVFFNRPVTIDAEFRRQYAKTRGQLYYKTHSRRWKKDLTAIIVEQARRSQRQFYKIHESRPTKVTVRAWWHPKANRPNRAKSNKPSKGETDE